MSCLSRVGCLVVVIGGFAVGYGLYGDRLPSKLSEAAGKAVSKVAEVAGGAAKRAASAVSSDSTAPSVRDTNRDTTRDANRDTNRDTNRDANRDTIRKRPGAELPKATVTPRPIAWATIQPTKLAPSNPIAALSAKRGPAYVSLGAGQLAALLGNAVQLQLPKSATDVQLALEGRQMLIRAAIDISMLAGDGTLAKVLRTVMSGRDTIQLAGSFEPVRPGLAQFHVEHLRVKGLPVPTSLIPTVLSTFRRRPHSDGVADDAIGVRFPNTIADMRVTNGRLILYKAVPAP